MTLTLTSAHLAELAEALEAEGLPTADLADPGRLFFRLADADGTLGYAGLEGDGPDRLLRSLVTLPERRGIGNATRMLTAIETRAVSIGVERLHLLTATAAPFFYSVGYRDAERADAPSTISQTREFTQLCPADAAYLVKNLDN